MKNIIHSFEYLFESDYLGQNLPNEIGEDQVARCRAQHNPLGKVQVQDGIGGAADDIEDGNRPRRRRVHPQGMNPVEGQKEQGKFAEIAHAPVARQS